MNKNSDWKFHTKASSRIRTRSCFGNREELTLTSDDRWKANLWTKSWWEIKKNLKEVWEYSLKMVTEWWIFLFFVFVSIFRSRVVLTGARSHVVATYVCATGCVHTLTCCTHFFLVYIHCEYTSHIIVRVTHMHGSRVSAVRMSSSLCLLTFSLLMCHPSLLLLFLDGHFETFPWPRRPKSAGQAHSAWGRGLADSRTPQVMSPKKFDKNTSVMTRRSSTIRTTISPTSRKTTTENTRQFGVPTFFESSDSQRFHDDFALQRDSKETFLIVNMLDEILMNYTMIQEIWWHYCVFWEQKELRKVRVKNHCSQHLYLVLGWEQDKTSKRWKVSCASD